MYGHKKKVCLDENISIGSFHNVSIYVKCLQKLVMANGLQIHLICDPLVIY